MIIDPSPRHLLKVYKMSVEWLQCKEDTKVLYLWWYDTAAILDEYDDSEEGVLPKGELVKISNDVTYDGMITLDLKNHKKLMRSQLPKDRVHKIFLFCTPTPLTAVVSKDVFESKFVAGSTA